MNPGIERILSFWRANDEQFSDALLSDIVKQGGKTYADMPRDQLRAVLVQTIQKWQAALETDSPAELIAYTHTMGLRRAVSEVGVDEIMVTIDQLRAHIWQLMRQVFATGDWEINTIIDTIDQIEDWLHQERTALVNSYGRILTESRKELIDREQTLAAQSRIIQDLSTPIVPIHEGVLVLPLVGVLDARRATQVMESVLEQIVGYQADTIILDITGISVVDTNVANHLLQLARAVKLLGAYVVLVGIGSEIAQTIVQLGVDLSDVNTQSNLQSGIAYALSRQGFAIAPMAASERAG